jgi:hypothetical protein
MASREELLRRLVRGYMNTESRQRVSDVVRSSHLDIMSRHCVQGGSEMPGLSRDAAPRVEESAVLSGRYGELDRYTVGFEAFRADADGSPFFRGLPDDRCQSPHWGYVISGALTLRYADREERFEAGDAYYAPPGHVPLVERGTELVEFSPTEAYEQTMTVVARNVEAAGS